MPFTEPTLDCQNCGGVLRKLTAAEAQQVAANPYNFIAFCSPCGAEELAAAARYFS
ncbi:hypothetical protein [Leifsonia sp. Leaf264]|uniref:hypothetical protein n=1 Tax=Leifsonia sp. Leaf264 TaxID=1736314 RepID=UPI000AC2F85B|nr:hypothetical protein [Leifsonia sp. Leaf264]